MVLFLHIEVGVFGYLMCKIRISMISTRNPVQLHENGPRLASYSCLSCLISGGDERGISVPSAADGPKARRRQVTDND
ncbi:hypothetical protein GCM10008985_14900 [Halococcus dombrowskii]|uniref:Uncharacterized protein n=1 Tax=Halococcus dombrowskii TaxID=179637 RepID=A0AAV3SFQ8_HALDO